MGVGFLTAGIMIFILSTAMVISHDGRATRFTVICYVLSVICVGIGAGFLSK